MTNYPERKLFHLCDSYDLGLTIFRHQRATNVEQEWAIIVEQRKLGYRATWQVTHRSADFSLAARRAVTDILVHTDGLPERGDPLRNGDPEFDNHAGTVASDSADEYGLDPTTGESGS